MIYFPNSVARLRTRIKDIVQAVADPGALSFTMKEPDGTTTTYVYGTHAQLVRVSTGDYYVDWTFTQAGVHKWGVVATGVNAGAQEARIDVRESEL